MKQAQSAGQWCRLCRRGTSKENLLRHYKAHHLFCKHHFTLHPKAKSKCFGIKLIKKGKMYKFGSESEALIENMAASLSVLFLPIELRVDTWKAFTMILSSRALLDQDLHAPFFFLSAMLRAQCLACQLDVSEESEAREKSLFFHSCRQNIEDVVRLHAARIFNLFGLELDDKSREKLLRFLHCETKGREENADVRGTL